METLKNYLLVTIEKRFIEPSELGSGGYYNEHFIECQFQTRKSCLKYKENHSLWHSIVLTKKQYELSIETTGPHTL